MEPGPSLDFRMFNEGLTPFTFSQSVKGEAVSSLNDLSKRDFQAFSIKATVWMKKGGKSIIS